jgi:hypothetical protein
MSLSLASDFDNDLKHGPPEIAARVRISHTGSANVSQTLVKKLRLRRLHVGHQVWEYFRCP